MLNLIPWRQKGSELQEARHPLATMREEFDSLFNRFFGNWPLAENGCRLWGIETDETENEFVVKFEVPGFETDELDVNVTENQLTVRAERKSEAEKEKSYARFEKSVLLPNNIEAEKIEAKYRNGILEIHAPKKPEAVGRRIEVKA